MRGRTTLIVTHRLATIHNLDQIIVLEHGRIVEQGTGPELRRARRRLRETLCMREIIQLATCPDHEQR